MQKKKVANNSGTQSLLVELLTEELPPKSLQQLAERFRDALAAGLERVSLLPRPYVVKPHCFATPRRLAVLIQGVLEKATDISMDKAGPLVSAGAEAAKGFAGKYGVALESLKKIPTSDGDKWLASYTSAGAVLDDVLAQKVEEALKALPVLKLMRWGDSNVQFIRPVHGLMMMHGKRIIPGKIWGLESRNYTLGHRFLNSGKIEIPAADQYDAVLEKKGLVIVSFYKRKELIRAELEKKAAGTKIVWDDELLDEVTALVEYPVVYSGSFGTEFLVLPQECLILSMKRHQRYFPITDASGRLMPRFLMVSNMRVANPANIIHGNERVLRARLADAKFFYDQDRKTRLEARVPRLAHVVYHNKLGSQLERVERIQLLTGKIARAIGADLLLAERAAWLSKADLLTDMVGEFPELQGLMGSYYAKDDHEDNAVVRALADQYKLRFEEDSGVTRESLVSACLYLADRIDIMIGFFGIGESPTGEKDPFGLRRAALGIISVFELIGAHKIADKVIPDVRDFLTYASSLFPAGLLTPKVAEQVHEFILERYWNSLAVEFPKDAVEAVISRRPNLAEIKARVQAVQAFRKLPEAESLAAANKRIRNILRKSEPVEGALVKELLREPAERALLNSMLGVEDEIRTSIQPGDYAGTMNSVARLCGPVDAFFDKVLVNAEDLSVRANRHALLKELDALMNQVADISKLAS